jgi:hypothetical protein
MVEDQARGEHEEVVVENRAVFRGDGLGLTIDHGHAFGQKAHACGNPVRRLGGDVAAGFQACSHKGHAGLVDVLHARIDHGDVGALQAVAQPVGQRAARGPCPDDDDLGIGLDRRAARGGPGIGGGQCGQRPPGCGHGQKGAARAVKFMRHRHDPPE